MNEELAQAQTALRAAGCDFVLLSSIHNVTYVSGFEVPIPVGAGAETAYGPSLALCAARSDGSWLITSASNGGAARAQSRLGKTLIFGNFDSFAPLDSKQQFMDQTRAALIEAGLRGAHAVLGIEARSTPYAVVELLMREFPQLKLVDVDEAMAQARQIKTTREIGLLRRAAQICAIGHQTLAELVQQAGRTEFEMWAELCQRMFRAVGHEVPGDRRVGHRPAHLHGKLPRRPARTYHAVWRCRTHGHQPARGWLLVGLHQHACDWRR